MNFPVSDPKYGEVVSEEWFEQESGVKRVAILKKNGHAYVCIQAMYTDRKTQKLKFGKAVWLRIEDDTAEEVLDAAKAMMINHLNDEGAKALLNKRLDKVEPECEE